MLWVRAGRIAPHIVSTSRRRLAGRHAVLRGSLNLFRGYSHDAYGNVGIPLYSLSVSYRGQNPYTAHHNDRIRTAVEAGHHAFAFRIFDEMKRSNVETDEVTVTELLKSCVQNADADSALELLSSLGAHAESLSAEAYTQVLCSLCSRPNGSDLGWIFFRWLLEKEESSAAASTPDDAAVDSTHYDRRRFVDTMTFNVMLRSLIVDKKTKDAWVLYRLLESGEFLGIVPNLWTLEIMVDACAEHGEYDVALELLLTASSTLRMPLHMKPFQALLFACSQQGNVERMLDILATVGACHVGLSDRAIEYAITSCVQAGQGEAALSLWQEFMSMREHRIFKPTRDLLYQLLIALDEAPDVQLGEAFSILREFRKIQIAPDEEVMMRVLSLCCRGNDVFRAHAAYQYCLLQKFRLDTTTYNKLISLCIRMNRIADSAKLLRNARLASIEPSRQTFLLQILQLSYTGSPSLVRAAVNEMMDAGFGPPDIGTLTRVLQLEVQKGDFTHGVRTYQLARRLRDHDYGASHDRCDAHGRSDVYNVALAPEFFEEMLKLCLKHNRYHVAREVFLDMEALSEVTGSAYDILAHMAWNAGDMDASRWYVDRRRQSWGQSPFYDLDAQPIFAPLESYVQDRLPIYIHAGVFGLQQYSNIERILRQRARDRYTMDSDGIQDASDVVEGADESA